MVDRAEQDFNGGADFVRPGQYAEAVASYDTSIAIKSGLGNGVVPPRNRIKNTQSTGRSGCRILMSFHDAGGKYRGEVTIEDRLVVRSNIFL
ncbi:MAG: hypothetical protein MUO95_01305 [Methanoregula sp.]|nr:hypothetical protein [Methanoregula sp.]